jgi:hypothetical protein
MPAIRKIGVPKDKPPGPLDCSRFYRYHELGMAIADIAREDNVSTIRVRGSLNNVRAYRGRFSSQAALHSQAETVVKMAELERAALALALTATEKVEIEDDDGTTRTEEVPNHEIQLRASEILTQKTEVIQPKVSKGISIMQQTGILAPPQGAALPPRGYSIEERLRELQAKRQGLLPAVQEPPAVQPSPIEAEPAEAELVHDEG